MLERGEGWGVFDGERLVGKLTIDALPYPSLAHTFWVHAVYVHPDARGSGASSALMQAAIEMRVAKGARRIALWVNESEHDGARASTSAWASAKPAASPAASGSASIRGRRPHVPRPAEALTRWTEPKFGL